MPLEKLSIKRMRVSGAFPAVLGDLNFKFSQGSMPPLDLPSMFMFYHSVHSKERLQRSLQTNCQSIHLYITSPYWWESKSVSKRCEKWENWEVRIDLAKNIMTTPLKVRCKTLCTPNAAACNATILVCAKRFKKARACTCHTLHNLATGSRDDLFPVVFALPWEVWVRDESLITASAWRCC